MLSSSSSSSCSSSSVKSSGIKFSLWSCVMGWKMLRFFFFFFFFEHGTLELEDVEFEELPISLIEDYFVFCSDDVETLIGKF